MVLFGVMSARAVADRLANTEGRLLGPEPGAHIVDDRRPGHPLRKRRNRRVDVERHSGFFERLVRSQPPLKLLEVLEEVSLLPNERLDNRVLNRERAPRGDLRGNEVDAAIPHAFRLFVDGQVASPALVLIAAEEELNQAVLVPYASRRHYSLRMRRRQGCQDGLTRERRAGPCRFVASPVP